MWITIVTGGNKHLWTKNLVASYLQLLSESLFGDLNNTKHKCYSLVTGTPHE